MHVDLGNGIFHGLGDIDVVVAVEVGVDSALQSDFGCAHRGGFCCALRDVVECQQIRRATKIERELAFRETAEATLEGADVRVVDVAVVYPRDDIADGLLAQFVGEFGNGIDFTATCAEHADDLALVG